MGAACTRPFPARSRFGGCATDARLGRDSAARTRIFALSSLTCRIATRSGAARSSLRGATAPKQSKLSPRRDSGLLRFARNDGLGDIFAKEGQRRSQLLLPMQTSRCLEWCSARVEPLAFQPRLGSRQFHQAPCEHARFGPLRSRRRRAGMSQGRRRGMTVRVRTAQEHQVAHDAALSVEERAIIAGRR
jgi:hypothetical protein